MSKQLTEEEVFANDKDPLEALAELRRDGEDFDASDSFDEEVDNAEVDEIDAEAGAEPPEQEEEEDEVDADEPDAESDTAEDNAAEEAEGEADGEAAKPAEKDPAADEPITFKANGQEFSFTRDEVIEKFSTVFGQAMDYTKKMQAIAPYRRMISAIESEGISQDQLNLAIDALKGNKDAIREMMVKHDISAFDIDDSAQDGKAYTPNVYGKDESQIELDEVVKAISVDKEYAVTVDVVDRQWDSGSRAELAKNPAWIRGLHNDIKTGLYDRVAPLASEMKVLDGNKRSDIEYYMLAGQEYARRTQQASNQQNTAVEEVERANQAAQAAVKNSERLSSEAEKRRAASPARARSDRKTVVDYLDDDDEAFDEWYSNLQKNI